MKAMDAREMDDLELESRIGETRQELFNLRFQSVTGRLDNYSRLGVLKRDVAMMSTILREREIARAEGRPEEAAPRPAVRPVAASEAAESAGSDEASRSGSAEEIGDIEPDDEESDDE